MIDDEWSTVGSSNLDPLSLSLNLEANLVIRDSVFAAQLRSLHPHGWTSVAQSDVPFQEPQATAT